LNTTRKPPTIRPSQEWAERPPEMRARIPTDALGGTMRLLVGNRMLRIAGRAVLLAALFSTEGCSTPLYMSTHVSKDEVFGENKLYYFLPKAIATVQLSQEPAASGKAKHKLTVTMSMQPDPLHLYAVKVDKSVFARNEFTFQVSDSGLLTFASAKSKDETPTILSKVVELAAEVAKAVALDVKVEPAILYTASVDPTDGPAVKLVSDGIRAVTNLKYRVVFEPFPGTTAARSYKCTSCDNGSGLRFRPVLPYFVKWLEGDVDASATVLASQVVLIPQGAPILAINIERHPFIETDTKLTLSGGVLTKFELTKPSEVLAFIQIPIEMLKAIAAIPASMLQVRIDQFTKERQLSTAEREALEAQAALARARAGGTGPGK
jgi:hypothetical protein